MNEDLKKSKSSKKIQVLNLSNISKKKLNKICEDMLKNKYFLHRNYPIVEMKEDDIWSNPVFKDRSFSFTLHTLVLCEHLVNGYEAFNNKKYLDKSIDILRNWKKFNYPDSKSKLAWHDHATALRLIVICKVFESCRIHYPQHALLKDIKELVRFHCNLLSDSNFYMPKHNHGLDQDIALYIASVIFKEMKDSSKWRELSIRRFWLQINELFADDGSYLEHSPHYSYLLCDRLLKFLEFIKNNDNKSYKKLEKIILKQLDFLIHITQPDGLIPSIGDSISIPLKFRSSINLPEGSIQKLRYLKSKGTIGNPPDKCDKVFSDGGYAIFRNKWHYDHQTTQLIFYSSFHSRVHKHHDDQSIILFGHNQPLLIDSGKYNYNYTDPGRKYIVSSRAHNTVIADNKNTDTSRLNIGKSGLTSYFIDDNFCVANGVHCLYSGIVHQRTILYMKPWDIIILDILKGHTNHRFEQVFNFYPNIDCISKEKSILGKIDDKCKISLSPLLSQSSVDISLVRGQNNPLIGWCSLEHGKLVPTWSGSFKQKGSQTRFATHINLQPNHNSIQKFEWTNDLIDITINNSRIKIIMDADDKVINYNDKLCKMVSISQPKIETVIGDNKLMIISLTHDKTSPQPIGSTIKWECNCSGNDLKYSWYIFKDSKKFRVIKYSSENSFYWKPIEPGRYRVKVFVKDNEGLKKTKTSEPFSIINVK